MAANSIKPSRFYILWFKNPQGHSASFRFSGENLIANHKRLLASGYTEIADPFRKGAKPWGNHE